MYLKQLNYINHIFTGRGVVSLVPITKGKLVLEYEGKVTEGEPEGSDTYVFEICHNRRKQWCVYHALGWQML
jgi:hypothetical protein